MNNIIIENCSVYIKSDDDDGVAVSSSSSSSSSSTSSSSSSSPISSSSSNCVQIPTCGVQVDGTGLDLAPGTIVLIHKNTNDENTNTPPSSPSSSVLLSVCEQSSRKSTTPHLTLNYERAKIANFIACTSATLEILPTPIPDEYVLDRVFLECIDAGTWKDRSKICSLCCQVVCQGITISPSKVPLYVLMCDPYLQGVISEKTKIIMLPPRKRKIVTSIDSVENNCGNFHELTAQVSSQFVKTDCCHDVAVVSDDVMCNLGIKQNSWVSLSCNGHSHVAQLSSLPFKDSGSVYVHPCLLFNMGIESDNKVRIDELGFELPVAQEVHLARVLSAESSGTENYAYELWKYFKSPRSVTVGDVIAVKSHAFPSSLTQGLFESSDVCDDYCSQENTPHQSKARSVLVYFTVTKIISDEPSSSSSSSNKMKTYIVNRDSTKLIQTGVVNSFIPKNAKTILNESILTCQKPLDNLLKILSPLARRDIYKVSRDMVLLHGPRGTGKRSLCAKAADSLGMHFLQFNCYNIVEAGEQGTAARLQHLLDAATKCSPCLVCLDGIEALERPHFNAMEKRETMLVDILHEFSQGMRQSGTVVLVGTTPSIDDLRPATRGCFAQQVHSPVPDESERAHILRQLLYRVPIGADVSVKDLSIRTASFTLSDLRLLVARAGRIALTEHVVKKTPSRNPEVARHLGLAVVRKDFDCALKEIQARQGALIGRPKIPNIRWSDVGGLEDVKQEITDTIRLPLTHGHLFPPGTRHRSGVLLYGPPGTGKTLLAKAVATELSLNFLSVKGPELISMYVGESERNIRAIFQTARDASPCVIFFDELDSLAPKRGAGADSGGVMDRVVSQLLAELDGVQKASSVFVIGATNRPDLVDPALLCPGRFDRLLYLGICPDPEAKLKVITALTSKFHLDEDVDLDAVARACPPRLTGADMYALCSGAMMAALREEIEELSKSEKGRSENNSPSVIVKMSHFLSSLKTVVPSVSEQELKYYESLHSKFKST